MQTVLDILGWIFGAGGLLGFASYILFFKESKRVKSAEAYEKELSNLKISFSILQERVTFLGTELKDLHRQVGSKNNLIGQLYKNQDILEKKYAQKKSAINCAFACTNSTECPVLLKLKELEEEYLQSQTKLNSYEQVRDIEIPSNE